MVMEDAQGRRHRVCKILGERKHGACWCLRIIQNGWNNRVERNLLRIAFLASIWIYSWKALVGKSGEKQIGLHCLLHSSYLQKMLSQGHQAVYCCLWLFEMGKLNKGVKRKAQQFWGCSKELKYGRWTVKAVSHFKQKTHLLSLLMPHIPCPPSSFQWTHIYTWTPGLND